MINPPLLQKGNKIAIVAPAGKLPAGGIDKAVQVLSAWGLEVVVGDNVYNGHNYFSASDEDRLSDLQKAFDDPDVSAILSGRGGYGTTRILQRIDFKEIVKKPKWLIGFSDLTALHLQLQKHNVASIHGPMATSFTNRAGATSIESLREVLFKGISSVTSTEASIRTGKTTARITGGNLSLVVDSLGTSNEIDTKGKILFLEDIGEKSYRIDRMLNQLLRANKLRDLEGLLIGHFTDIGEGDPPLGESWKESITSLTKGSDYPISFGWGIGHEPENLPIVMGGHYILEAFGTGASLELQPIT